MSNPPPPQPPPPDLGAPFGAVQKDAADPIQTGRRRFGIVAIVVVLVAVVAAGIGVWSLGGSDDDDSPAARCLDGLPIPRGPLGANVVGFIDFDAARASGRLTAEYDTAAPTSVDELRESFFGEAGFPYVPASWTELLVFARDEPPPFGVSDARCLFRDAVGDVEVIRLTDGGSTIDTDERTARQAGDYTSIERDVVNDIDYDDQPDAVRSALAHLALADAMGGTFLLESDGDEAVGFTLSFRDGEHVLTVIWVRPGVPTTQLQDDVDATIAESKLADQIDLTQAEVTVDDGIVVFTAPIGSDIQNIRSVVQLPNTALDDPLLGGDWLDRSP